jgi:hypothetical protein
LKSFKSVVVKAFGSNSPKKNATEAKHAADYGKK